MTGAPERPIHAAAREGNIAELNRIIDQEPRRLNEKSHDGSTPLLIACKHNQVEVVRVLLERRANINLSNRDRVTPLMEASRRNFLEIVRLLVEGGADVFVVDKFQQTALHFAAFYGNRHVAAFLLDKGAEIEALNRRKETPLLNAALGGFVDVFDLLAERGANRSAVSKTGNNLLMIVTKGGNLDLFDRVNNLHPELFPLKTYDDWDLLMTASYFCHPQLVERILRYNPNVNARTLDGRNPLIYAATIDLGWLEEQESRAELDRPPREEVERRISDLQERRLAVIRLLLQHGADKNQPDAEGRTALELTQDEEVRELLRD